MEKLFYYYEKLTIAFDNKNFEFKLIFTLHMQEKIIVFDEKIIVRVQNNINEYFIQMAILNVDITVF